MNFDISTLNDWGQTLLSLGCAALWQSSLLIGAVFGLDALLRRRIPAAARYALWMLVLVKLVLPPSLASPTSLGWWFRSATVAPSKPHPAQVIVTYGSSLAPKPIAGTSVLLTPLPQAYLSPAASIVLASGAVSLGLMACILVRWRQVARETGRAARAPREIEELLDQARQAAGLGGTVRIRLIERSISPRSSAWLVRWSYCPDHWPRASRPASYARCSCTNSFIFAAGISG